MYNIHSLIACILHSICGKVQIREMMNNVITNDYELIDYNSLSIDVSDTIAVEKYKNTYRNKREIKNQIGIIEWHLKNEKWSVVNDIFRD